MLARRRGLRSLVKARVIAADSMGVRSFSVVVEACGYKIGIDLGASLAPRRYGLPPHEVELERLEGALAEVRKEILDSNIIIITHYHYDHYVRGEPDLYKRKILLIKHPRENINPSQRGRSARFLKAVEGKPESVEYADGRVFRLDNGLTIEFSEPVWHGEPGTKVGRVLMVRVLCEDESIIYTSDIQGPADPEALEVLARWSNPRPKVLFLGGPPTYFAGYKVPVEAVEEGLRGMEEVIRRVRPKTLVYDHHLLRDINYIDKLEKHYSLAAGVGVRLVTAAEFMGRPIEQLEARRRELWGELGGRQDVEIEDNPLGGWD